MWNDISTRTIWERPWGVLLTLLEKVLSQYSVLRVQQRCSALRRKGMYLGVDVNLPRSVWIDTSHCHLISIGDFCGFGDGCCILAHDALANQFLDATRIGRVTIHHSCHIGARTVILPGVQIGPRTIIGAGSVVSRSIPAGTVAAGNPARVLSSLEVYLEKHRGEQDGSPVFAHHEADLRSMSESAKSQMRALLVDKSGYIVGGYSAKDSM